MIPWPTAPAALRRGLVAVAAATMVVAGCGSEDDAVVDTPTCASLRELASVLAAANEVPPTDPWPEVRAALVESIEASDAIYRDLVAADVAEVSDAAADLLAFDEAILASGALDAGSPEVFASTVASLPGSAESGAGSTVLKEYGRETCGFGAGGADDDEPPG